MAVWYLDNDDEITDAVARLRTTSDKNVVFVVPAGSRIATGRINFKLLAREAAARDLSMAVASSDEQVRSLAISAGVLGLANAEDAEAALERGDDPPIPSAAASIAAEPDDVGGAAAGSGDAAEGREGRGLRRRRLSIIVVLMMSVIVVGGFISLETLPTAQITLVPGSGSVGPIEIAVTALTSVEQVDVVAREIPAVKIAIPLTVESTFPASGSETVATNAIGDVIFSSSNQSFDQDIAAGTRVLTPAGVGFQTTAAVVLPRPADGTGSAQVSAPVEAIEAGPDGNVPASTITVVPSLASQGISVSNPAATAGGELLETPIVTRSDYDAATVDLRNRLAGAMAARLRDPASAPAGLRLFAETARLGDVEHQPPAADVVGQPAAEFALSGVADAAALGVDEGLIDAVVSEAVLEFVADGWALEPDSLRIEVATGSAGAERIEFISTASGRTERRVETDQLLAQLAGLPVSEARAILEGLGTTTVSVWPDFLGDLPNDHSRITLDVQERSTSE